MLTILDSLPDGFLDCSARDLGMLLNGPTLIRLPGRRSPALFVSVLLHGNEDSGLAAVQQVLREHVSSGLPRELLLLVGNVVAASQGMRRLDGQPDYNRVWPNAKDHGDSAEAAAMRQVHDMLLAEQAFAAIDLHNNSGLNPHYGIVCSLDDPCIYLASLFSRIVTWFRGMPGTQTSSLAGKIPAMAAECGQPGEPANAKAAARLVHAALSLAEFPPHPVRHQDIDLFHTLGVVRVKHGLTMSFDGRSCDIAFDPELDHMNFRELAPGSRIGKTDHPAPLTVTDEDGREIAADFFSVEDGVLVLRRQAMPAMLTRDALIVRQDCLCYLMERLPDKVAAQVGEG